MLTYDTRDGVAWLTLDRPDKLNAMEPGFWDELTRAMDRTAADDRVRVAVFSGAGRCFSVGGDIESFGELGDTAERRAYVQHALLALRAVEAMPKPTIAAVHGHTVAGGCELTMVCDIVVADETASFGTPEGAVGLMPGLAVVRGRAHVNLHWMKFLTMTGERVDARTAQLAGLVNVVVPEGEHVTEASRLAAAIAKQAPTAMQAAKRILGRDADEGYAYAAEAVAMLMGTRDHAEGIAAFVERREPSFEGR